MDSKRSYISTPMTEPYIYQSVPERLKILAEQDPSREAFIFYDMDRKRSQLTRKEVWDQSVHIAKCLVTLGLSKGSHVAFCMNNSMEMLLSNFGVQCAGGIPFYLGNILKDGSDIIATMNEMQSVALFIDANPTTVGIIGQLCSDDPDASTIVPTLKYVIVNGNLPNESSRCFTFASLRDRKLDKSVDLPDINPEDVLAYLNTSGSTGKPKMVGHTHFGILNWTKQCDHEFQILEKSIFFCDRTFGWLVGYPRTYFTEGATRIFIDTRMALSGKHIGFICEIIGREKCDVVYIPGYIMADLNDNHELAKQFTAVRTIIVAGERATSRITTLQGAFCQRVCNFYGNTECGGVAIFTISHQTNDFEDGIIGKPVRGTEIKITDADGQVVPVGHSGQLNIRSASRFIGYKDMDELFRDSVDVKNWFHSGDIAHIREDGSVVIEGREKELISIGTTKIFPWYIEKSLRSFPGAASIFAVGVPDKRLHQTICVCGVPPPGKALDPNDIERFCEEKFHEETTGMGIGLKPKYYLVLDSLPLTPTGKVDRRTIGIIAKEKLGL